MNCEVIDNAKTPGLADEVVASIRQVYDPEIPINVYDLGLIYKIHVDKDDRAFVTMTLTTPNCPVADSLPSQVESVVMLTEGVTDARVELTFEPPFTIDMMSDEAKLELGFM
ncbi:MAG: iron-sulfur cluster assembly protein [Bacteroidetes bacterium]|nr:iron-sulfur cluster assembly protein [Bacteroidota bacterium]MCY4233906.1 iron-sulfur cluster assembly protein [Bacteroidota bacterium]